MKPRSTARLFFPLASAISVLLAAPCAVAETYYWDSNVNTAGFGSTTGTWGTSAFWTKIVGGGATHTAVTATTTSDTVNFGGTSGLSYAGATVGVAAGGVSVGNITVGAGQTSAINVGTGTNVITLAATSTITHNSSAGGNALTISSTLAGAGTSLTKAGPGTLILSGNNTGFGIGSVLNHTNGLLRLSNANALGGATGFTINMGDTGAVNATILDTGASVNIANNITILASSAGTLKTIRNGTANAGTFSGNITANDDLTVTPGANSSITVSGIASTIATTKTVSFTNGHASAAINDSAIWGGLGKTAYSGSSGGNIAITGLKTYSGGATLDTMSSTGVVSVNTSSVGPANAPTSGAFGTGTLSIGATKVRAGTTADMTVGNAISFTANPTFSTIAAEKSLIFTGDADLGAATRILTVEVGSTVPGEEVEFQGVISSSTTGTGLTKAGAGMLRLSGISTYTGDTLVNNGTLALSSTSGLKFLIGADDVNNKISGTGAGTVSLDGLFTFDLTGASTTVNDSWNIVDVGNLTESFGSNFSIFGFTPDGGGILWNGSANGASYEFSESLGTLTVVPEPTTAALLGGLGLLALLRRRR